VAESDISPTDDWKKYRVGGGDRAARKIDKIYALGYSYVIYFSGSELFYEVALGEERIELGEADMALARINRLLPFVDPVDNHSYAHHHKISTLELVADAFEMVITGERLEGLTILDNILVKLQMTAEGKRRLVYQAGAVFMAAIGWIIYLGLHNLGFMPLGWEPWMLAAALAMAGGAFSVCLNLAKLEVSINQQMSFLLAAGATRSIVALLAGIGLLLAMRAKMVAGFAYQTTGIPPAAVAGLVTAEMFFCFLAGFSETFVPNILRDSEKNPGGSTKAAEQVKIAEQAKIVEQVKIVEQAKIVERGKGGEGA
jgi:hypothetical protein